jgi:hypothetical protein
VKVLDDLLVQYSRPIALSVEAMSLGGKRDIAVVVIDRPELDVVVWITEREQLLRQPEVMLLLDAESRQWFASAPPVGFARVVGLAAGRPDERALWSVGTLRALGRGR